MFGFHKSKANFPVTLCTIPATDLQPAAAPELGRVGRGRSILDKMESIDIGGDGTKYQPIDSD